MKKLIYLLFICLAANLTAEGEPFFIRDIRSLGMGSAFTAMSDDANCLFYNPAGVAASKRGHLTAFQIGAAIGDDLKEGYNWYNDNSDDLDNMDTLKDTDPDKYNALMTEVVNKISNLRILTEINFPQSSYIRPGKFLSFGFGFYTNAFLLADINPGIIVPTIDILGRVDGIIPVAFGKNFLNNRLSVGISPKIVFRNKFEEDRMTFLEMENFNPEFQTGSALGWDIGAIYKIKENLSAGLAIKDFGGTKIDYPEVWDTDYSTETPKYPAHSEMTHPQMNVGISYRPQKLVYWPGKFVKLPKNMFLVTADLWDIWRTKNKTIWSDHLWPKIHFGVEANLLSILRMRFGINQGYPTYGFDINLFLFHIEYARWADELGMFAGEIPDWKQKIALTLKYNLGWLSKPTKKEKLKKAEKPAPKKAKKVQIPESEKTNIAVAEFEARPPLGQSDAAFISEFIRTDLINSGLFNVVEKNNMNKILVEQGFQQTGCSDADCAAKMGKILNVKSIIVGSCGKLLGKYVVTMNAVDVGTGKITYSDNITVEKDDQLRESISKMAEKFAKATQK
ncbi:MAG: conjugal transfer protein TraF [Elusimicrobia bacterium]|nr:conjugal transfer protein TraF [Elusimicrobiota bacterium]